MFIGLEKMKRGQEDRVIEWLKANVGKITLSHIGVLKEVQEIGKMNDNRKKGDVYLNGLSVSLKDVESSFLHNRIHRKDLIEHFKLNIDWFDNHVRQIHEKNLPRNVKWQGSMILDDARRDAKKFKAMLRELMLSRNPKQGISDYPAEYILTHPRKVENAMDISLFNFDEFFDLFAENWISYAFKRCWYGQGKDGGDTSEHDRAKRILSDRLDRLWSFEGVSGKGPNNWRSDIPPEERKTCFTCSIEIKSPAKWENLRRFRVALLESGFYGVDSFSLEKVTHTVKQQFGQLIDDRSNEKWQQVLEIATQTISTN